jgi:hypothetical protein
MDEDIRLCACIGPVGDCPCIRRQRGLPVPITETTISPALFELLPDEDKNMINDLKVKALGLFMDQRRGREPVAPEPESRTAMMKREAVVEQCDALHYFLKQPDHPKDSGGMARCPYCLSVGLDATRREIESLEGSLRHFQNYFT